MQSFANLPVIGLDLAKSVFQLHIFDAQSDQTRETHRVLCQVRSKPGRDGACGASHYWARTIRQLGHEVRLLLNSRIFSTCPSRRNVNKPAWRCTGRAASL